MSQHHSAAPHLLQRAASRIGWRRGVSSLLSAVVGIGLAPALLVSSAQPALALDNGLARTPYMGWNTYYGLGDAFNDAKIRLEADAMVSRGLKAAGYRYVWLDGGWWSGTRDGSGNITVDPTRWPNGMKGVADYIHSRGLRAGIYTDAGIDGCGGAKQGSFGHYQQDVNQFAAWGYDAVKVDYCGGTKQNLDPAAQYGQFRDAILNDHPRRPMVLNICNPFPPGTSPWTPNYPPYDRSVYNSYSFGPSTGNSWRTDGDIGFVHSIQFKDVLRNLDHDAAHPEAAGPGHWNDPDYLGPELGMTSNESQAQFSMWTVVAAPLIIGSDVSALSQNALKMLTNDEVLDVSQDVLGVQGKAISTQGNGQVWVRPLANGDRAVALLNRGTVPTTISTDAKAVGMRHGSRYNLRDLWHHATTETAGTIAASVPGHSVVLYRVSPGHGNSVPPAVLLSPPSTPAPYSGSDLRLAIPAQRLPVSVTFTNYGRTPVKNVQLRLSGPAGWAIQPSGPLNAGTLATGRSYTGEWSITPPAGTLPGSNPLVATVTYRYGDNGSGDQTGGDSGSGSQTGGDSGSAKQTTESSVLVPPAPPSGISFLSDHTWLDASSGYLVPRLDTQCCGNTKISLLGKTYDKGIGTATPSQVEYYTGGNCTRVTATVGIDDSARFTTAGATAVFQVFADGRKVFDSGLVTQNVTKDVNADVSAASVLTLVVGDAGDGGYNDRSDWANLQISCGAPPATVPHGPWPHFVATSSETATATSANTGYPASNAIDGKLTTLWHSRFSPVHDPLPISLTIDTGGPHNLTGLTYQPRLDGDSTGIVTGYSIALSTDGINFAPATSGTWADDSSIKSAAFRATTARYIRLTATSAHNGYASAAEVGVADIPAA